MNLIRNINTKGINLLVAFIVLLIPVTNLFKAKLFPSLYFYIFLSKICKTISVRCSAKHQGKSRGFAILFIKAKTWKQPRCPVSGEWVNKLLYTYEGVLLSHPKE